MVGKLVLNPVEFSLHVPVLAEDAIRVIDEFIQFVVGIGIVILNHFLVVAHFKTPYNKSQGKALAFVT